MCLVVWFSKSNRRRELDSLPVRLQSEARYLIYYYLFLFILLVVSHHKKSLKIILALILGHERETKYHHRGRIFSICCVRPSFWLSTVNKRARGSAVSLSISPWRGESERERERSLHAFFPSSLTSSSRRETTPFFFGGGAFLCFLSFSRL